MVDNLFVKGKRCLRLKKSFIREEARTLGESSKTFNSKENSLVGEATLA